ncbi:MAG: ribonuclease HII [Parvularculaceae bacterium]|nr:ribonuclease HII [Parvularculaceae bacterium]
MPLIPTYDIEDQFSGVIAGVDEAGRGPWAGPVVAAAVVLDRAHTPEGVRDSKTLTEKRRRALAAELWKTAKIGVGVASVEEIDSMNILAASLLAMARAVANLPVRPAIALVDGNIKPKLQCRAYTVIGGDGLSVSIAAASIIAKTTRDRMMMELARDYPNYAWGSNKGYAAPAHRDALAKFGVTPHHRRSFAPIHNMLYAERGEALLPPAR